jgi:hypothetical protein
VGADNPFGLLRSQQIRESDRYSDSHHRFVLSLRHRHRRIAQASAWETIPGSCVQDAAWLAVMVNERCVIAGRSLMGGQRWAKSIPSEQRHDKKAHNRPRQREKPLTLALQLECVSYPIGRPAGAASGNQLIASPDCFPPARRRCRCGLLCFCHTSEVVSDSSDPCKSRQ